MAQLFGPRFGFAFRLVPIGLVGGCASAVLLWRAATAYPAGANDPLEQPVPFSHKHHAGDDGIDCRYCSSPGSAARPAPLGLPRPHPDHRKPSMSGECLPAAGPWRTMHPREAAALLRGLRSRWWIAGGWALDLFIGRQSRPHRDLDIGILRGAAPDAIAALPELEFFEASDGTLQGPLTGAPRGDVNSLWGRSRAGGEWVLELMLDECDADQWVFRRARAIRRSFERAVRRDPERIPYLAPEIQLLYKAGRMREQDRADFAHVAPHLEGEPRAWLLAALSMLEPTHPWLARLRSGP